jgi:CBS domain-containing protein
MATFLPRFVGPYLQKKKKLAKPENSLFVCCLYLVEMISKINDATSENNNNISLSDTRYRYDRGTGIDELKVEHFMTKNPVIAHSNANFAGGVGIMTTNGISNLIVMENKEPIGILTEREILHYLSTDREIPTYKLLKDIKLQPFCKVNLSATILDAARKMTTKKCRILVFKDKNNINARGSISNTTGKTKNVSSVQASGEVIVGIITASDLVRAFAEQINKNPSLRSIMSKRIFSVDIHDSIYGAINIMYKRNIGSVVVVENMKSDRNNPNKKRLYGIFTERDLLTKVLPKDVCLNEEVKDYCSTQPLTAPIGITAIEAAKIMLIRKIKRIPLVTEVAAKGEIGKREAPISTETIQNDNKYNLVGIVTARDLVEVFESS